MLVSSSVLSMSVTLLRMTLKPCSKPTFSASFTSPSSLSRVSPAYFRLPTRLLPVVAEFKSKNKGHVINLGSIAGREAYAGGSIYTATKHAVRAFTGSLLRELVNTQVRVTEIDPGMVETEFSVVRYRGDENAAKNVYKGLQPRELSYLLTKSVQLTFWLLVVGEDIAEEIVWAAARPPHVNIAEVLVFPVNQASAGVKYSAPE